MSKLSKRKCPENDEKHPFKNKKALLKLLEQRHQIWTTSVVGVVCRVSFVVPVPGGSPARSERRGYYTFEEAKALLEEGVEDTLEDLVRGSIAEATEISVLPIQGLSHARPF